MLHTNNPIIKHKAGLLNLAQELQNISRACKVIGISRDTFYRYQELVAEGGVEALIDKSHRSPNLKNRVDESIEDAVKAYAVEFPAHGQHRTSNGIRKQGVFVSGSGVPAGHKSVPSGYGIIWRTLKNGSRRWKPK